MGLSHPIRHYTKFIVGLILCGFIANSEAALKITHWQTAQGTPVYFVPIEYPQMVDIQVVFNAGSSFDATKWGLANFVNSMLGEQTKTYTHQQIAAQFDRLGAQVDSNVTRDIATVHLRSLSDNHYLNPAVNLFSAILSDAKFPANSITRVRNQIITAINQDNPIQMGADRFFQTLYGSQPYGHATLGTMSTISAINAEQLSKFYQQFYAAKNAQIILVGALTQAQAAQIANQITSHLPAGQLAVQPTSQELVQAGTQQKVFFPAQQSTILMGEVAIKRQDPNYFPLMVGNYTLGGSDFSSWLFEQIRNQRGLAYTVASQFLPGLQPGPFLIFLQTQTQQTPLAIQLTQQTLLNFLNKGPSAQELMEAKRYLTGNFPLQIATNTAILNLVTGIAVYHLPLNYADTYNQNIEQVTQAQINAAFKKVINPSKVATIIVGPK